MSYHQGFLYLSDFFGNPVEIVNEYRTKVNIQRALFAGVQRFGQPDFRQGCAYLNFEPCTMASNGAVTAWQPLNTAVNAAPWWSTAAGDDASEAYGFFVEEWTGLDGGHHGRTITPRGSYPGGGLPGWQTSRERVMAINLIAVGSSERALNHLFRWLESTLLTSCSPQETFTLWLREHCPVGVTDAELGDGLVYANDTVLVAGPTWVDPPVEDAGCYLRRLTFTLAAGDPCLHRIPGTTTTSSATHSAVGATSPALPANCSLFEGSTMRDSIAITAPPFGSASAIVRIYSTAAWGSGGTVRKYLPALRIVGFADRDSVGSLLPCTLPRIGLITLDGIPSGYDVYVDCSTGKVTMRDSFQDRSWFDGSGFLQSNADYDDSFIGPRRIALSGCNNGYVMIEPALVGTTSLYAPGEYVASWTTEMTPTSKYGCA